MGKIQPLNYFAAYLEIKQVHPQVESKAGGKKMLFVRGMAPTSKIQVLKEHCGQSLNPRILTCRPQNHKMSLRGS